MSDNTDKPEQLRVNDLKSALSAAGVELPPTQQKKSYYVELYRKNILENQSDKQSGKKRKHDEVSNNEGDNKDDGERRDSKRMRKDNQESDRDTPMEEEEDKSEVVDQKNTVEQNHHQENEPSYTVPEQQTQQTQQQQQQTKPPIQPQSQQQPQPPLQSSKPSYRPGRVNTFQQRRTSRRVSLPNGNNAARDLAGRRKSTPFPTVRYQPGRTPEEHNTIRRRTVANTQYPPIFMSPELNPDNQFRYDRSTPSSHGGGSSGVASSAASSFSTAPGQIPKKSPVQSLLINLLMIFGWLLLFVCVIAAVKYPLSIYQTPAGKQYCDSEEAGASIDLADEESDCQPCPAFGYCAAGRLFQCAPGYEMKSGICVQDEELARSALSMIEHMQGDLSWRAGKAECGELETSHVTKDEIEEELQGLNVHPSGRFSEALDKAREMIENSPNFALKEEKLDDQIIFYSTSPRLPYLCKLERKAQENMNYITFAVIFLVLMFVGNIIKNRRARRRANVEYLIGQVMHMVREQPRVSVAIRDELKEQNNEIDVIGLWPDIEKHIKNDSRIIETLAAGNKPYWEWNDIEPRQLSYNSSNLMSEGDSLISEIENSQDSSL
eukprot:gb/GECH01013392.1/.p1 GENE.gb/GECH01013392.1/~~gb/GECH01013392.1/.p1  ORF type:complete len:606 (+),score=179.68 gb/GECH01013392.1/:1-1818(+)